MKKRSGTRKKRPSKPESCTYSIEILDWGFPYYISVNYNKKLFDGLYLESRTLKLIGKLLAPKKLSDKTIDITISGSKSLAHALEHPEEYDKEPTAVGGLEIRGEHREFYGFIPFDIMNTIILTLQSEKIKFLVLDGQPLRYGSADIKSIDFSKDYNPDDWT
jgi:hypothetical protein